MELEEAKKVLNYQINMKNTDIFIAPNFEAIETVLQALDNSIPKEKVEKRLNNIEEMLDKTARGELQKCTPSELILIRIIYNELLEEDNEK